MVTFVSKAMDRIHELEVAGFDPYRVPEPNEVLFPTFVDSTILQAIAPSPIVHYSISASRISAREYRASVNS